MHDDSETWRLMRGEPGKCPRQCANTPHRISHARSRINASVAVADGTVDDGKGDDDRPDDAPVFFARPAQGAVEAT